MSATIDEAVKQYAIRLGDDALILGHRLSEWGGFGPFLEEDLALTNVALDFVGRARMFYSYAAELAMNEATEDTYAYHRDIREFSNLLIFDCSATSCSKTGCCGSPQCVCNSASVKPNHGARSTDNHAKRSCGRHNALVSETISSTA